MSVTVDSGEFRLWRNIQNLEHQPSRMAVINAWVEAYGYATPPAMNSLADVIQDVFDYPEIWRELGANSADEF
jgi:hypothetical protein